MVKNLYQNYSEHLNRQNTEKEYRRFKNYFLRNYLKYLPPDRRVKILDIGCGTGLFLKFLVDLGYQNVSGIDLSQDNIKIGRQQGLRIYQVDAFKYLPQHKKVLI